MLHQCSPTCWTWTSCREVLRVPLSSLFPLFFGIVDDMCTRVYLGSKRHGAGSGVFLHYQHSCIGCGRDASQQFLQHKELRWPCSWLLLILLLESAALRGLQPHFYWKSCAVMKPFSLWLGYCSHKSSYWPLGSSHMFVLLQCYVWTFVYWQSGSPITALMLKSFTYNFFKVRSAFSLFFFIVIIVSVIL